MVKVPTSDNDHVRLEREYLIGSTLKVSGVCEALDLGRLADGRTPYIVFERLWGKTLAERIEDRKRLRWREAVSLVRLATVPLGDSHKGRRPLRVRQGTIRTRRMHWTRREMIHPRKEAT